MMAYRAETVLLNAKQSLIDAQEAHCWCSFQFLTTRCLAPVLQCLKAFSTCRRASSLTMPWSLTYGAQSHIWLHPVCHQSSTDSQCQSLGGDRGRPQSWQAGWPSKNIPGSTSEQFLWSHMCLAHVVECNVVALQRAHQKRDIVDT